MHIVINEWLLEYSIPGVEIEKKSQVNSFFNVFLSSTSKIIIGRETPFTKKFYRFFDKYGSDPIFKHNYSKLYNLLFRDQSRTIIVEAHEMKHISDDIFSVIHDDDRYLINLAITIPDSIIITTDTRLIDALSEIDIAKSKHLLEYIESQ